MNYTCYLISNKPQFFPKIQESILPEKLNYFDGTSYPSFSKLVNSCAEQCPTEIVIILSDKVYPTSTDIQKMLSLIEKGHGLVCLYRFGFFGFKKELMRRVGMLDERFSSGGYEDDDYYIRLKESNISMYVTEEATYEKRKSSWNYSESKGHFFKKWTINKDSTGITNTRRNLTEIPLNYNLGPSTNDKFLTWEHTVAKPSKSRKYI